jgi:WD40 repeat protein
VGNELAINSPAGVRIWNTETWQLARDLTNFIGCLFMPDGQTFWLTSDFRTAGLYNYRTLELLLPLPTGTLPLAVSRDGRYLAASLDARHLQVWDLADVRERLRQLGLDWTE